MKKTQALKNLPHPPEKILSLISQELKIRRMINGLQKAGIESCSFEPSLDSIILAEMGIDDGSDKTIAHYCKVIDRESAKIKPNRKSIKNQSVKVYRELLARHAKRKR
jgi:hypothetical protein